MLGCFLNGLQYVLLYYYLLKVRVDHYNVETSNEVAERKQLKTPCSTFLDRGHTLMSSAGCDPRS